MSEIETRLGLLDPPEPPAHLEESITVLEWAYKTVSDQIAKNTDLSKAVEVIVSQASQRYLRECLNNRHLPPEDVGFNQGYLAGLTRLRLEICDLDQIEKSVAKYKEK